MYAALYYDTLHTMTESKKKPNLSDRGELNECVYQRFKDLYELQSGETLITLAGNGSRRIHASIVSAFSEYFKTALSEKWHTSDGGVKTLDFSDMKPAIADAIFLFLYCLEVTKIEPSSLENIHFLLDLAETADQFLISEYRDYIIDVLTNNDNRIYILMILCALDGRPESIFSEMKDKLICEYANYVKSVYSGSECADNDEDDDTKHCCLHKNRHQTYKNKKNEMERKKQGECTEAKHDEYCCMYIDTTSTYIEKLSNQTKYLLLLATTPAIMWS